MEKLKPCPFCGGEAHIKEVVSCCDKLYTVGCSDSGCMGFETMCCRATMDDAAEAWNRRAERTCRLEWRDNGDGYPPSVRCSACGGWLDAVADVEDVALFEFCPMCGAKVIG